MLKFNIFNLPNNIINKIMEYDSTYHEHYKKVINEIKMFPIWNVKHVTDNTHTIDYYFHYTIARDILNSWNKTYSRYIKELIANTNINREINEMRELINFLDTNKISTEIIGRKQNIFEWIRYSKKLY